MPKEDEKTQYSHIPLHCVPHFECKLFNTKMDYLMKCRIRQAGNKDVLIATDIAAKGLDFPDIQHVINFDMPDEIENYVHRIGRTGRCGKTGVATTFINKVRNRWLKIAPDFARCTSLCYPLSRCQVALKMFLDRGGDEGRPGASSAAAILSQQWSFLCCVL